MIHETGGVIAMASEKSWARALPTSTLSSFSIRQDRRKMAASCLQIRPVQYAGPVFASYGSGVPNYCDYRSVFLIEMSMLLMLIGRSLIDFLLNRIFLNKL